MSDSVRSVSHRVGARAAGEAVDAETADAEAAGAQAAGARVAGEAAGAEPGGAQAAGARAAGDAVQDPPIGDRLAEIMALAALTRAILMREMRSLAVWALAMGALAWYSADALSRTYGTEELRLAAGVMERTPGVAAFTGPGHGLEGVADGVAPSLGALVANEVLVYLALGAAVFAILVVVRHTRATEETGQAELVRAGALRPGAEAWIIMLVLDLGLTAISLAIVAGFVAGGLSFGGAVACAAGAAGVGMCLGAAALLAAQLAPSARSARGLAFLALLGAYQLRAVGDALGALGEGGSWLSLTSPMGWAQAMRPWAGENWWWALPLVVLADAAALAAMRLAGRRDLDAAAIEWPAGPGLTRPGPRSPWTLALRIHSTAAAWWTLSAAVMAILYGALTGSLAGSLGTIAEESEYLAAFLGGAFSPRSYVSVVAAFVGIVAGGCAVALMGSAWRDELAGRAEVLVAAPRPRSQRAVTSALAAAVGSLLAVVAGMACLGVTSAASTGQWELARDCLVAAVGMWPACLLLTGIGALATGVGRAAGTLSWGVYGLTVCITLLADLLDLPQWLRNLSVMEHVPDVLARGAGAPGASWGGALAMALLAVALVAAGATLTGRRDVI